MLSTAPPLETDALHVLPADVEHAIDRRVKKRGGGAVCDRLHLTLVEGEGRLEQRLAIARGAGADDLRARRERVAQRADTALGGLDGVSAVAGVERIEQLAALADEGELRRGGARVDAEGSTRRGRPRGHPWRRWRGRAARRTRRRPPDPGTARAGAASRMRRRHPVRAGKSTCQWIRRPTPRSRAPHPWRQRGGSSPDRRSSPPSGRACG